MIAWWVCKFEFVVSGFWVVVVLLFVVVFVYGCCCWLGCGLGFHALIW